MVRIHSPRPFDFLPPMPIKRFLVQGLVQGVGFRYFVLQAARGLGLAGFVRNLPDGAVEAVAHGNEDSLRSLESQLRKGPALSRVDSVSVENHPSEMKERDFSIRH